MNFDTRLIMSGIFTVAIAVIEALRLWSLYIKWLAA